MTITPTNTEGAESTATSPIPETEQQFDWQNCWYPVTFIQDFPKERPYPFRLYDRPLVLFRNSSDQLICLLDRCPHRAAKLSDGQIIDGKLECSYHGWQFGAAGECLHIPQLPEDAKISPRACSKSFVVVERQGIIWLWAGEAETADEGVIPAVADWEHPGLFMVDMVADLPIDATYVIENFLDPAHVVISHDRTQLYAKREDAQPLEMEILKSNQLGIQSRYRQTKISNGNWVEVKFVPPNLVLYRFGSKQLGLIGGLATYAVPLSWGQCRVIARRYDKFFSRYFRLRPRWLEHLRVNKVLEEDLPFILELQKYIERTDKSLKEEFLPLKTLDVFVIEYRKWLDKYGKDFPFYEGYVTSKRLSNSQTEPMPLDRLSRHTQICSSCNRAHRRTILIKQILVGVAIALAALAILSDRGWWQLLAVSASLLAVALAVVAEKLKTKFEQPYTRH